LFWHDHFACSYDKVDDIDLLRNQNRLFRLNCKGNFSVLVKAVNKDAAMMEFLDTVRNRRNDPNENYGRELQELFTLGVKDLLGNANYEQADVFQIARAFTGWDYDDKGLAEFHDSRHDYTDDYPERGPKRIFKSTGGFGINGADYTTAGEGAQEIDGVIDVILQHRYGPGLRNTVADHIAHKLITYFAHPAPAQSFVADVVDDSGFDSSWDLASVLKQIFVHDDFYLSAGPASAGTPKSVKWPIDFTVSALRLLHMKLHGKYQETQGGSYDVVLDQLTNMGQILFQPPSVFGWDWELSWMSSSALLARYAFARDLVASRDGGGSSFQPAKVLDADVFELTDAGDIVDAVADALGIDLAAAERTALIAYLTDNNPPTPVDLHDLDTVDRKLRGLFALLLQSPAFQLQ
jgi:uncharacterized protein (DUF1800 family)